MKKKNFIKILIALLILTTPNVVFATKYIVCDGDKKIPYIIPSSVALLVTIVRIIVPILLVISGMLAFFKVAVSGNVDDAMQKAKSKLKSNIIAAIVIFFAFSIVNFAVSLVAGGNSKFMRCAQCFLNTSKCKTTEVNTKLCPGLLDGEYDENCKLIKKEEEKKVVDTEEDYGTDTDTSNNTNTTPKAPTVTINQDINTSGTYGPKKQNEEVYINGILVVNKTYSIPSTYGPASAKGINTECIDSKCFSSQTWNAWNSMKDAATFDGIHLRIGSGYRSYEFQNQIYMNYVARDGQAAADTYSARPGHSEHQTGLAMDICSTNSSVPCITSGFDNSAEAKWLSANCYKYGFIIRYPQGKEDKTGYKYESWHIRYVGTELAKTLHNNGNWISIEEYFDITSQY